MSTNAKRWALVPARGGSKSIRKKNLALLGGYPLIAYGVTSALKSGAFEKVVCSTDDEEIGDVASKLGVEVDWRPSILSADDTAVADVARDFLQRHVLAAPNILALVQPTSPFLLPIHVHQLLDKLESAPGAKSAQTITQVPHNSHSWNQRDFEDGLVSFKFRTERGAAYIKQLKPKLFSFGNLVAIRSAALIDGDDFFAEPSVGVEIEWPSNIDVDGPNDLMLAEALINAGLIRHPLFLDERNRNIL